MRRRLLVFAIVYGALVAAAILSPLDPNAFWDFLYRRFGIVWTLRYEIGLDVLVNVLLFVPIGFLVQRWRRGAAPPVARDTLLVVLGAALASTAFEAVQWAIGHRDVDLLDVASDTAGAALGCAIDRLARRAPKPVPAVGPAAEDS
ncbi:MAG: VanZ family protein [Candidatus Rokubacteria bacterium]|nr:VanZ family protein [Candidatus Rokubacteria bacterium]